MGDAHRVVIVGGGFGGLYAAKSLKHAPVELTLIDRRNFHLFQPLLYQVATGGLSPGDIASPLRSVLSGQRNTKVLLGEVTDFDVERREVILADAARVGYDSLIIAAGSRNHYFGSDRWEQYAPGLKTVEEATEIRQRILYAFEAAERESDPEKERAWLTFVVVGGGPTGVELAGALGEIANDTLRNDFRTIRPESAQILLLEGSERILEAFPAELAERAVRDLIRLGVRTLTGSRVVDISASEVTINTAHGRQTIPSRTVLWAAGVKACGLGKTLADGTGAELDRSGRLMVQPDLTIPGHPEIFVIGDLAHLKGEDGKPLPGVAPVAMQQGRYVARLIEERLRGNTSLPFHYRKKGNLATIGRAAAIADFGWLRLKGFPAWVTWLFVHLLYLVNFQNRVVVLIQWAFQYFTFNRGARLITGEPSAPEREVIAENVKLR